ncbi:glycosyltransferase family 39 protein [Glaciihabitans sp. UYNi722]|uniref:ArnT family glycosyltransferase n=1 Tax=Glaciihabitans sp. UYNi722 TaxID=3156344 RepID=UPI003396423A
MTSTVSHGSALADRLVSVSHTSSAAVSSFLRRHRRSLVWLTPVLVVAAVASFINMGGSPQRIDDEGTYTAQAWAINALHELAHYTFWYDHPPLGWLQIAGYTQLTGAFGRYDVSVLAAREAVIVMSLIGVVLLWALSRRLGLSRPASAVAALIFALSPLAVQYHRTVYLDNVATPWLIAAFLLALSRRQQLAGFAASAACFSIAVLSKETFLLALPFLAWTMIRNARPETRRYTLAVASSVLVLVGFSYVLLALIKGELIPGSDRVSLISGVGFQLGSRASSGSIFDPGSLIVRTFSIWWHLDPVIMVLGSLASVTALFVKKMRPIAAMMVFLLLFMFRPGGYLPVPYVIMLLPFAALLIAWVTDVAVGAVRRRSKRGVRPIAWLVIASLAAAAAVPLWTVQLRGLFHADLDQPLRSAEQWVDTNVAHDNRLIVDDAMWVDFVRAGWRRDNVVWYYKIDTDPAVEAQSPRGWKDSDYIITTDSMRTFPDGFPQVKAALQNSVVVASFGQGTQAVDIRRIEPQGAAAAKKDAASATQLQADAGKQLTTNTGLKLSTADRNLLTGGQVDVRIPLALGSQLAAASVQIDGFPIVSGEDNKLRRQVVVTAIGGKPVVDGDKLTATARDFVAGLVGDYAPSSVSATNGSLLITYPADPSVAVIQ